MRVAQDLGDFYRIPSDVRDLNYEAYFSEGAKGDLPTVPYSSNLATKLSIDQTKELLLSTSGFRELIS
jgi:UDP-glucose 4-epimerase